MLRATQQAMLALAVRETPLVRAHAVSRAVHADVWVKRDDATHDLYGGNKVRKLARILSAARERGATDLLTVGAVGSHHVFATIVHGRSLGFEVHAVLVAQPHTSHVEQMARADLAQGGHLLAARGAWEIPILLASTALKLRLRGRRPFIIPMGGSTPTGALGYVDGMVELGRQIEQGAMPGWPDTMVCALGSGGTYAGLLVGARALRAQTEVLGVQVTDRWMLPRPYLAWMASRAADLATREGLADPGVIRSRDLLIDHDQLGRGYGHATPAAREAQQLFALDSISLDLTYTAKAAAALLSRARHDARPRRYLFWQTLSSTPMEPMLERAPELPVSLRALMLDA